MKDFLMLLFVGTMLSANGQQLIEGTNAWHYTTESQVDYIKIGNDTTPKPVIIFLQGSLPVPLVMDFGAYQHVNLPFQTQELLEQYHLVMISMPGTPVVVERAHLSKQYCYLPDSTQPAIFASKYLEGNYLQHYVSRTQEVMQTLAQHVWSKQQSIHLVGHSQGAKIAAVVAAQSPQVTTIALLGFNAFGRYDELLRRERLRLKSGQIDGETYRNNLQHHYEQWKAIHAQPNTTHNGHKAWTTFSINYLPYLLQIETPIYVGYGTNDIIAENCDLLQLHFIAHQKNNLTSMPYAGLDHNFFELHHGQPDYENGAHWGDVMLDVVEWINNTQQ